MSTELARTESNGTALSEAAAKLVYRGRDGRPYSPVHMELVQAVCRQLGLVAWLRHVVLIQDVAYISNAGLLHIAQQSGQLDGITTRPALPAEREAAGVPSEAQVWVAEVWRAGSSHPFTGWGRANPSEPGAAKTHPQEMAQTRAVNRALRLAFGVGMTSLEEMAEEPSAAPLPAQPFTAVINHQRGDVAMTAPPHQPGIGPERAQKLVTAVHEAIVARGGNDGYADQWLAAQLRAAGLVAEAELSVTAGTVLLEAAKRVDVGIPADGRVGVR